jgi:hypothetical protein
MIGVVWGGVPPKLAELRPIFLEPRMPLDGILLRDSRDAPIPPWLEGGM